MSNWHCNHCGHHHGDNRCQTIIETDDGGAQKCCCTGEGAPWKP